jgi:hypothetical protein
MNKQMQEQKEKELREEMMAHGYGWIDGKYTQPPEEYMLRKEELSCISMIDSILAYGGFGLTAEQVMKFEERSYHNYLDQYVKLFGRAKVVELIQGQIDSISSISHGVFTDGEGCTYNSINYKN